MRANTLAAIMLLVLPSVAAAQGRPIGRAHASLLMVPISASLLPTGGTGPATIFQRATSVGPRSNYWLEGAIAGGTLLGVAGVLFAIDMCNPDSGTDNCVTPVILGVLTTATVGAVVGAFVGKAIHKGGDGTPP